MVKFQHIMASLLAGLACIASADPKADNKPETFNQ